MSKLTPADRVMLLATGLLAAYQVAFGIEGTGTLAMASFTVAFGLILLEAWITMILGFEVLESPTVVILSTVIPLGLSLGLVVEYLPGYRTIYLVFAALGLLVIAITRFASPGRIAALTVVVVHGVAGILIFILPLYLSLSGRLPVGFSLVSLGGGLIGLAGLLLSFLKTTRPLLSQQAIWSLLPGLFLLATLAFVVGFQFV